MAPGPPSPPPRRRPTLKDVADFAGVSIATASYVFSGRGGGKSGVSVATEKRVWDAATTLKYRPNTNARATRKGRSDTVQLSLNVLDDPWALATAATVTKVAREHDLVTLILGDGDWHRALGRMECNVAYLDGVHRTAEEIDKVHDLVARGQRLVVFSETMDPDGFDVIRSEDYPGCLLAMEHLLEEHTRIGCLSTDAAVKNSSHHTTRYSAYLDQLRAHGIPLNPDYTVTYDGGTAGVLDAGLRLLSASPRPTAVFAVTDFAAVAVIQAAHTLGLRVPQDVAVIGAGNTPQSERSSPRVSTVGPTDFFARQAEIIVARAVEEIPATPQVHEFAWSVHIRGSTRIEDTLAH